MVLIITHTDRISGAERVVAAMFRAVSIPVTIVVGDRGVGEWFIAQGLAVEYVDGLQPLSRSSSRLLGLARLVKALFYLRTKLSTVKPVYLHVLNPVALCLASILNVSGVAIPVVLHCHDFYEVRAWIVRAAVRLCSSSVAGVVAVSLSIKSSLLGFGFSDRKICVLYNGVIGSGRVKNRASVYSLVVCGYFEAWKGLHIALAGFIKAVCSAQNRPATLTVIGIIPDPMYAAVIRSLIRGYEDRIIFLGSVPNAGLLFKEFGLFLHTPVSADPFPTVVLEAMASGCFPIVSPLGGAREAVAGNGIVIDRCSADEVCSALLKVWQRPDTYKSIAEEAKRDADSRFSIAAVGNRYMDFYTDIRAANEFIII